MNKIATIGKRWSLPNSLPAGVVSLRLEIFDDRLLSRRSKGASTLGDLIERENNLDEELGIVPDCRGSSLSSFVGFGRHDDGC